MEDESSRRFSFLVDQEYQRQKDEQAAARKPKYQPGWKDYVLFVYFCVNVAIVGNPLLNTNAVLRAWKNSEWFKPENTQEAFTEWSTAQSLSAKTALLLFQSGVAASGMMGGVLVDTFSAAMCLLVAHVMSAIGSHFLQKEVSRQILMGCLLQSVAGELLLNCVLPICGLFGDRRYIMLLILTCCAELSVLIYPILLTFYAPVTPITAVHADFYREFHGTMVYVIWVAAIIGTFILPVDDNGDLMPVTKTAAVLTSSNLKPAGILESPTEVRFGSSNDRISDGQMSPSTGAAARRRLEENEEEDDDDDDDDDIDIEALAMDPLLGPSVGQQDLSLFDGDTVRGGGRKIRQPVSLWGLPFAKKLKTLQFQICCAVFTLAVIRNSFYLNNNQQLLEAAGDNGTIAGSLMWMMGIGAILGPLSWHWNDTWPAVTSLLLLAGLNLAVNLFTATRWLPLQWLTIACAVAARSSCLPTILTYAAGCFGLKHFPAISVLVGLLGCFANFANVYVNHWGEVTLQGDFYRPNLLMLGLGAVAFIPVLLHWLYPTISEEEDADRADQLKEAVATVDEFDNNDRHSILDTSANYTRKSATD